MKILVVSALFPPDVAPPAPYIKELVGRLSAIHEVTVLTYGNIPEAVDGVRIVSIKKNQLALWRALSFARQLTRLGRSTDVILAHNAPSVELPLILAGSAVCQKTYLLLSDTKIRYQGWKKRLNGVARYVIKESIVTDIPVAKLEKHPFRELPTQAVHDYEKAWEEHLAQLQQSLHV